MNSPSSFTAEKIGVDELRRAREQAIHEARARIKEANLHMVRLLERLQDALRSAYENDVRILQIDGHENRIRCVKGRYLLVPISDRLRSAWENGERPPPKALRLVRKHDEEKPS